MIDGDISAGHADRLLPRQRRRLERGPGRARVAAAHRARRPVRRGRRAGRAARVRAARRARRRRPARRERRDHRRGHDRAADAGGGARGRAERDADLRRQARRASRPPRAASAPTTSARPIASTSRARRITHSRRLVGHLGREMLLGGFDRVLDCVGSGASLEQATTITRARGRIVLVGMPGELKADLAAAWLQELEIKSAYGYENDFPRGAGVRQDAQARPADRPRLAAARLQEGHRARAQGVARRPRQDRLRGRRMSIAPTRMIERSKRRHPAAEREACVVEVHEHSPPTLFHSGETFRLERLPGGLADRLPAAAAEGPDRRRRRDLRRARLAAGHGPAGLAAEPGHEADDRLRRHLACRCRR